MMAAPPRASSMGILGRLALWAAAALLACTCATGRDPPKLTAMATVQVAGAYLFGTGEQGCNIPQGAACETNQTFDPSQPTATVDLKPFAIDVHEVTIEQYGHCDAMEQCSKPAGDNGPSGIPDYYTNSRYDRYPVVMVRHKQAEEYCKFAGKRLPTEFEWEVAAGGAAKTVGEKRIYPWAEPGFQPALKKCDKDVNIAQCNGGLQLTKPVESSVDDVVVIGGVKVFDLAGNVAEYTSSDSVKQLTCDLANPDNPYTCEGCKSCLQIKAKAECASQCQPCKCGAGSTEKSKPNCYQPCETPICARRLADSAPLPGYPLGKNFAQHRVVRGGSYYNHSGSADKMACDGRFDNRSQAVEPTGNPQTHWGFRCAKSL
ncbi:MAG: SUMF1/EgtB/PvdO family nonheme iron enzyme [Deltaproteobacteria bacterium]|nr:SUMF1/EgtB/PvdO family nonheme iron enzyme [Deltaproteobacteria bacterium]